MIVAETVAGSVACCRFVALKMIKLLVAELLQLTEYGRCNKSATELLQKEKFLLQDATASATREMA